MWASDRGYQILGTRFRVQSQDEATASEMARLWKGFSRSSPAARLRHTFSVAARTKGLELYRDCSRHVSGPPGRVVLRLLMEANRLALGEFGGFAAHAAVLATSERVAAVVADSGVGKSTLAASAVLAGLDYGSDEALCVDRSTARVVPYPKPIGLSAYSQRLLGLEPPLLYTDTEEAPMLATTLGGETMAGERSLTDIILPDRQDRDAPRFEPLAPSEAAAALLGNSFNHYRDPHGSYLLTARLAAETRAWRFVYSDSLTSGKALADFLS